MNENQQIIALIALMLLLSFILLALWDIKKVLNHIGLDIHSHIDPNFAKKFKDQS